MSDVAGWSERSCRLTLRHSICAVRRVTDSVFSWRHVSLQLLLLLLLAMKGDAG